MAKIKIIGTGMYVPGEPISNDELKTLAKIEFDTPKVENKLGIKSRHIAKLRDIKESTADFATEAARAAIKDAGLENNAINLFIVGTDTPEHISPATSLLVQGRLQGAEKFVASFDVTASCASFTSAYNIAASMMAQNPSMKYGVVTGVYNMLSFVRDGDPFGYSIFADGAGSFVFERVEDDDPSGYINGEFITDGTQWDYLGVFTGGTKKPYTHKILEEGDWGLQFLKKMPPDVNMKLWPKMLDGLLEKVKMHKEEIDHIIFTQINLSVIKDIMALIDFDMNKTTCIMDRYGYTGSGCIPMAMHHAIKEGRVKRGDKVMFIASGTGLAVSSNIFVY
ncbi:MAG: ketoacyl-ACP synthase III [Bacteriovoracaceae bacterium]|nr:ketoacyl-ACP synthase III [Bacteriovoracaceae bacterium]